MIMLTVIKALSKEASKKVTDNRIGYFKNTLRKDNNYNTMKKEEKKNNVFHTNKPKKNRIKYGT